MMSRLLRKNVMQQAHELLVRHGEAKSERTAQARDREQTVIEMV